MTTSPDLDRFLTDLDNRRRQLAQLKEPDTEDSARLRKEIDDLSEELLVVDEELRVQQEQLEESRARAESLAEGYARFLEASTEPLVLTDEYGGVLRVSRGARMLSRRHLERAAHPIATWFRAEDRRVIRSVITASKRMPLAPIDVDHVLLRRPDRGEAPVAVSVSVVMRQATRGYQLLWNLTPLAENQRPHLQLVPDASATTSSSIAERYTALASALSTATSVEEAVEQIVDEAAQLLAQARWIDLYLPGRCSVDVAPFTAPTAQALNGLQRRFHEGPALAALQGELIASDDLSCDPRWPGLQPYLADLPVRGTLAVPLHMARIPGGSMLWMSDQPGAFDSDDATTAGQFAVHAGLGLQRLILESQLRAAIVTRQRIGEAVGILVERHRITPQQAFAMLVPASQRSNTKLSEVAARLVETGEEPPSMPAPKGA